MRAFVCASVDFETATHGADGGESKGVGGEWRADDATPRVVDGGDDGDGGGWRVAWV